MSFENSFPKAKGYEVLYRSRLWEPPPETLPDPIKDPELWRKAKEDRFKLVSDKCILRLPISSASGTVSVELIKRKVLPPGKYRVVVYLARKERMLQVERSEV